MEDRSSRSFWESLLDWARNQNAGGGRINWVVTERKMGETFATELARAVVTRTGADATGAVFSPTCAVAQIEQAWWDAVEFSGCAWVACTIPRTHTRATQSTDTALRHTPQFANALSMLFPTLRSDDCMLRW
jgi:hypothetical protein